MSGSEPSSSPRPRLPEVQVGDNVEGPVVICNRSRPTLVFVWTLDDITFTPVPTLTAQLTVIENVDFPQAGIDGKALAPRRILPGTYTIGDLGGLDADNFFQGADARRLVLGPIYDGEKQVVLTKLAKPTIDVGWGAARIKKVAVQVTLTKDADSITVTTLANGTGAFPRARGLIPGQYTVTLPRVEDQRLYHLETVTVDVAQNQTTAVAIQLRRRVRPRIRLVNKANDQPLEGIRVTFAAGVTPISSRNAIRLGLTKASGTVEFAEDAERLVPGRAYCIEIERDPFNARLESSVIDIVEGPDVTIKIPVLVSLGVLVIEVNRHDGKSIRPVEGETNVVVTSKQLPNGGVVEWDAREVTSTVVKEAGREVTVLKAVGTQMNRSPGNYEVGIKDVVALAQRQDGQYSFSTPNWRVGPNSTGKMTIPVEVGKTTTAAFTLYRYKKVQFVGFNIKPGSQEGFRCVTCGTFSAREEYCNSGGHGLRAKYACYGHTPPRASNAGGDCAGHLHELVYLCHTCKGYNDNQGACTKPGCTGVRCWPYCPGCDMWFGNTVCVPCLGPGAPRRFPRANFRTLRCDHNVPATFPGATATCTTCLRQYTRAKSYLGLNIAQHDLGARCFIMKKAIEAAYASDRIKKSDSAKDTLKIFMAPEFYFRNTEGGYAVELLASIIEQMRDETSKEQYKDWLFVFGSAIGYLKHESVGPPSANSTFPLRITQVIPGPTTKLHIAQRTDGWATPKICDRIPLDNDVLTDLCQWKIKQGAGPSITIEDYRPIATKEVQAEIVQTGVLGTMSLKWRIGNSGAWSPDITSTAANAFTYKIPGHPCTIVFPPQNYVLNSTYILAQDGTRTGTGAFAVTTLDHATMPSPLEIVIETAGTLGTMRFTWNFNAVAPSAAVASVQHNAFSVPIHEAGKRLLFAPHNYVAGTYTVATNGTVTRAPAVDTAMSAIPLCGDTCPRTTTPTAEEYEIEVTAGTWAAGDCLLVEPKATEVFNVVFVQKGGDDAGVAGLRELLVYKEYVSHIDFLGPNMDYQLWHRRSGRGRVAAVHNNPARAILPTSGSRDLLAVKPNPQSGERTLTGLGGGSVFTVDGVTFGLEVCLDHARNKLYDYYKPTAPPRGTPKVQVHLIPSWGMSINQGNRAGVTGARIFNVDGPKGSFAGKLVDPDIQDPADRYQGKWARRDDDGWSVPLPTLPTDIWPIKEIDPASLHRTARSADVDAPFPLVARNLPAPVGGIGRFFQKKDPTGTTLAAYGNIKIFPAKDLPEAETI